MTKLTSSIIRQLQWISGISLVIMIISFSASFLSNRKLIETSVWVNHTNDVIMKAESMISTVKDAEVGQRGYIITDDPVFLQPYNGAFEKTTGIFDELRAMTADNPVQQKNLAKAKQLINQRFEQMQHVLNTADRVSGERRLLLFNDANAEMLKGKHIMDQLRKVVTDIKTEERSLLQQRKTEQDRYIAYTPVLVITAAVIALLITIIAYRRIKTELEERLRKQLEDEARYQETTRRIGALELVTGNIADGDYSARSLDNKDDDLGRIALALNNMAESLQQNFTELEKRNWLQAAALSLGAATRGERFVRNMAERILQVLAAQLNAANGTLYTLDRDRNLHFRAGYALSGTSTPQQIPAGQTLLGAAAAQHELQVIRALPADYLRVQSSLGHTAPVCVVVLPLVHNDTVIGVIELGMLQEPDDSSLSLLRNNADSLGISISSAINYERIQDLLEETQAQSEELQTQHAELENINTELEAQTEKLQASEEELKVQQEELQQANQELEERSRMLEERNLQILEKNIEVQRKAEELALSTKYKSEFLANMSHELRTPLNSILLLSRLLKENASMNLSKEQVEYAEVIQSSGDGLLALIDEILDLSKIEAGKMELDYEPVRVAEIVQDIKGLFEPVARERGLSFTTHVGDDVPERISTDKMRLEQILKNLIANALKFTKEGSVSVSVAMAAGKPGQLTFTVSDTGIGIPQEKQQLIFEAFQQADGSTRRKFGGTGLGLSISKELAKLLQGQLELSSNPGTGSHFMVTIPIDPEDFRALAPMPEIQIAGDEAREELIPHVPQKYDNYIADSIPEAIPDDRHMIGPADKSILIVEDDVHFARTLIRYTRSKGYKAISAVRGDEGLVLARQYQPVGILLDIQLPVKSGWEVMAELKADPHTRQIPVHIMSSHSVKKQSLQQGAIDFIDKPVAPEQMQEIFDKLEHVLNRSSQKVLIVEENPRHSKALAYFLETFNINSEIKSTISDSVAALNKGVDCVILDMGIPDQKSYDTLEEIKKNPGLEHLPIIIFTGKSLSLPEEQRIKQYADSIIVKTAHSYQRILDEVSLFLHVVAKQKEPVAGKLAPKLSAMNDVLEGKTVLIVDDDVRNIFSLSKTLERLNMQVLTAVDGKEAMDQLNRNAAVDVVLLDMMMPEMDGYETAKAIRSRREWKELPVIAVTAKAMTGDREKCIQAGASDYITKPVDSDQLISLLRVWLYERK